MFSLQPLFGEYLSKDIFETKHINFTLTCILRTESIKQTH